MSTTPADAVPPNGPLHPATASDSDSVIVVDLPPVDDGEGEEEEDNLPNREYRAADADFTLISADGVPFKVHKYVLMAAR